MNQHAKTTPALEAAGLEDLDIDHARELLRWADMYGEPEEWCKKAQALHGKCEDLRAVLGSFVEWFEATYPGGQSKRLPGLTLYEIAERARKAVRGAQPKAEPNRQSQRLILELTRLRQAYADAVNRKEEAGTDATYQRGLVAGLQAAIGKVEEVSS